MKATTFQLIEAIISEGLDNGHMGVCQDCNTRDHLGTEESVELDGQYAYVYREPGETFCFIGKFKPAYTLTNGAELIDFYKL